MMGIDFNKEGENGELKVGKDFEGSIWQRLGYTKYLCPKCPAYLKKADNGDLICLNGCHMSEGMRCRMASDMKKIVEERKLKEAHQ